MKKEKSVLANPYFYIALAIIIIILYLIVPKSPSSGIYDSFASCLTKSGAVMFGTDWCPHCKNQKALFGDSFSKIKYVNCDFNREECLRNNVEGFPTWKIKGQNYAGVQPLEKLAAISGCSLNK